MRDEIKGSVLRRLNRVGGQVGGIARMVAAERYCIDILTQISAVRAALGRIEEEVLGDQITDCVEAATHAGNRRERRRKIAELMDVLGRCAR